MRISVIVPTYRRPEDLSRCLVALSKQNRRPDEVVLVVRDSDEATWSLLRQGVIPPLPVKTATITVPGQIAAMNLGIEASEGDIFAFTDDDAAPYPDWLEKIESTFLSDESIGGVGGRDIVQQNGFSPQASKTLVGELQWYGRIIGNHHVGFGQAREVDILKGVNMSYRKVAVGDLRFDQRLMGNGAQVHNEVAFCLSLKRQGWRLIYDPHIQVDHYPAQRFSEDLRDTFNREAYTNAVHNETVALLDHLSLGQKLAFGLWSVAIGTSQSFGLLQWLRFLPKEGQVATEKLLAAWSGRYRGWQTWQTFRLARTFANPVES